MFCSIVWIILVDLKPEHWLDKTCLTQTRKWWSDPVMLCNGADMECARSHHCLSWTPTKDGTDGINATKATCWCCSRMKMTGRPSAAGTGWVCVPDTTYTLQKVTILTGNMTLYSTCSSQLTSFTSAPHSGDPFQRAWKSNIKDKSKHV